jgi:creatinine amidohydrolase
MYGNSYDGTRKKIHWQEFWRHELEAMIPLGPVVIMPVGSVEQHGPHCPMDVDISGPFHLASAVAEAIGDFPVIVAPPVWSGFTHYNMGHVGTINLRLETFLALVGDVCRSLKANGFERMILLNGHGGNVAPLRSLSVALAEEDVWALAFPYWSLVEAELEEWSEADAGSIGHGGEWETSLQLHLRPQLISREHMVRNDWPRPDEFSAEFAAFAFWPERRREAPLGVMGDPLAASAEKGERAFRAAVDRLARLVREYHEQPLRQYRQFGTHCP